MQLIPQNTATFVLLAQDVGAEADAMSICSQKGKTWDCGPGLERGGTWGWGIRSGS